MKTAKLLLSAVVALGACTAVNAGIGVPDPWSDNFDSYAPGPLVGQGGWEAWDGDPGAAGFEVTTAQARTGTKSVAITDVNDAVQRYADFNTGVWVFTAWSWVPSTMDDLQYFILLNQYGGAGGAHEWSLDLGLDGASGTVQDLESGGTTPLVTDQWVEIRIVINLTDDDCAVYYGGTLVATRGWSQGGTATLEAVDLWGEGSAHAVYYDDMDLREVDPVGACCFEDGSCTGPVSPDDCDTAGGAFDGFGTTCAATDCPVNGDNGWILDAPLSWLGNNCTSGNDCFISSSRDEQFEITIPYTGDWTFSLCGSAFDTVMGVGTTPCGTELGSGDDECFLQSEVTVVGLTPGVVYVTVEGFNSSACGDFTLVVSAPCVLDPDPTATPEGEVSCFDDYEDVTNAGCNEEPANFGSISCGEKILGTAGTFIDTAVPTCVQDLDGDGEIGFGDLLDVLSFWGPCADPCPADFLPLGAPDGDVGFDELLDVLSFWGPNCPTGETTADRRDTDWYELIITEAMGSTDITYSVLAEYNFQLLLITPGPGGPGDPSYCDDLTFFGSSIEPCEQMSLTDTLEPGTYWLWAGPASSAQGTPCGSPYQIELQCTPSDP